MRLAGVTDEIIEKCKNELIQFTKCTEGEIRMRLLYNRILFECIGSSQCIINCKVSKYSGKRSRMPSIPRMGYFVRKKTCFRSTSGDLNFETVDSACLSVRIYQDFSIAI